MGKSLTINDCHSYAFSNDGFCLSLTYSGTKPDMWWKCKNPLHSSWKAPFGNLKYQHSWCPECADVKRHTINDCHNFAESKNGKCLSEEYSEYIIWKCHIDEHKSWKAKFGAVKNNGTWCPDCAGNRKLTLQDCNNWAMLNKGRCLSNKYINNETDMLWQCDNILHEAWWAPFGQLKNHNTWCPECADNKIAKYFWYDVLNACEKIGIRFINCPSIKEDKICSVENKNKEWKFECVCKKIYYPALNNILQFRHNSCGCVKSKPQEDINKFIYDLGFITSFNNREVISPLELDIYIPEKKIAIEYCGLYWHGEINNGTKARLKHKNKLELCQSKNIRLITIFEDEWLLKQEQVKGFLRAILGGVENKIDARKCIIKDIANNEARLFNDLNHIQGHGNGKSYGLYFNNELVCLATFAKPSASRNNHHNNENKIELMRYTARINYSVRGGLGRLLKYFINSNKDINEIISYSDNRWSNGNLYRTLGFNKITNGNPSYFYFKSGSIIKFHRYNFPKHKAIALFGGDPKKETEWSIMSKNGFDRIWDCGSSKWQINY